MPRNGINPKLHESFALHVQQFRAVFDLESLHHKDSPDENHFLRHGSDDVLYGVPLLMLIIYVYHMKILLNLREFRFVDDLLLQHSKRNNIIVIQLKKSLFLHQSI